MFEFRKSAIVRELDGAGCEIVAAEEGRAFVVVLKAAGVQPLEDVVAIERQSSQASDEVLLTTQPC